MNIIQAPSSYMAGYYRVQIRRPDGRIRWDSGWYQNKLLDSGRNIMATEATWMDSCQVGTNSTVPTALDTQLLGYVVGTSTLHVTSNGAQSTAPYFGWKQKTFRFAIGAGHGGNNLSEVGVGWGTSGSTLVSRALIIDPDTGNPTTVTPLADELLDVSYQLRYYPFLVDILNTVVLDGETYDTITRVSNITSTIWSSEIGNRIGYKNATAWLAYNGTLGTVAQTPNGTSYGNDGASIVNDTYASNSYLLNMDISVGPGGWNAAGGIRCIKWDTTAGSYQTQFSNQVGGTGIPKALTYIMSMGFRVSWAELPDEWDNTINYAQGDLVTYNDVQYSSDINNNLNNIPPSNWTLI